MWSLQMPLFFLISGYVREYSKPAETAGDLWRVLKKRTKAYLLPWGVWTFLVRGAILGQTGFFNIPRLLWHMDSGYWFLFSLWMISLIFAISQFAAKKMSGMKAIIMTCAVYVLGMALFAVVGVMNGLSFLCLKLTLYYMPFYLLGYLYGNYSDEISRKTKDGFVAVCLAIWLAIILRVNLYAIEESLVGIVLRVVASLAGCIAISGIVDGLRVNACGYLKAVGQHSLEIYLVHYLFLNLLQLQMVPVWGTVEASVLTIMNYAVTLIASTLAMRALNSNMIIRGVLFGKA